MICSRDTIVLALLIAATAASALIAGSGNQPASLLTGAMTIAIATFKMRVIAYEFMEVASAPLILRVFITSWLLIMTAMLILIYGMGAR